MSKIDEMINKSLDEIDAAIEGLQGEETIKKGDVPPEEISEESPEEGEEGTEGAEEGAGGEEGAEAGEEGTDEDIDGEGAEEGEEDYEKSFKEDLNSDENVRKALEVSEFLTGLVNSISKAIGEQRSDLNKSLETSASHDELIAKSFAGIAKSQKVVLETQSELLKSVQALGKRVKTLEKQPVGRKSAPSAKAVEKSFKASLGGGTTSNNSDTLSKSEAVTILSNEYAKGNPNMVNDILALESTGDFRLLSPEAKSILKL